MDKLARGALLSPQGAIDLTMWLAPILICLLALYTVQSYRNKRNFWKKMGLKANVPINFVQETLGLLGRNRGDHLLKLRDRFGKVYGTFWFGKPALVVADPDVLRQICIKDFDAFTNHGTREFASKYERHFLVWLKDEHWKRVRAMMTPTFTSGKIRRMYKLLDGCADDLVEAFREQLIKSKRETGADGAIVDLDQTYSMYTMDGITTCCYGLKLQRDAIKKNCVRQSTRSAGSRNTLINNCKKVFEFNLARTLALICLPKFFLRSIGFQVSPDSKFEPLAQKVSKMIEARKNPTGSVKHDDLLQLLVDAKLDDKIELGEADQAENHHAALTSESILSDQKKLLAGKGRKNKEQLEDIEILSEALFLLMAGFDTTRSSLGTITYLLAHNQDVQAKLYEEVSKIARYTETPVGKWLVFDYDELTSCKYLDAVVSESLRFFGPVHMTDRQASKECYIEKYNLHVPKGMRVLLGLHQVANDPDYWKEPRKFNPQRFMPGEAEKIVPGSYMPFSMGPRHCVGMRFSLTETKLGLAKVIMKFKLSPAPNTKYPPEQNFGIGLVRIRNNLVQVNFRDY